ncbi:hypothetical protein CRG98_008908 [Punica granatum]|uniref:Uncharacterized protein n=1 Tax=Punica granatum TaxID=22663 RepID=A0A2I0KQA7_PUNGR|nr:hypothetical protein CRG98_008908 [Punica granatum]
MAASGSDGISRPIAGVICFFGVIYASVIKIGLDAEPIELQPPRSPPPSTALGLSSPWVRLSAPLSISTLKILFQSIAILLRHRLHFLLIYAFTALPLSFLLFSLPFSVHPVPLCRGTNRHRMPEESKTSFSIALLEFLKLCRIRNEGFL